ncbi:hypothetical protein L323_14505 [Ruminiclostridium papyrosolvens C7]|uniref:Uncharacterized protein n=1 Tax=Ruminiclostridium papyrosolvens C7 TaxID=1330534 RepID=U4QZ85_9FIRM|nr:hypothetical protein L323_14505 [Ruminiclostridium papyrosolvens C7]
MIKIIHLEIKSIPFIIRNGTIYINIDYPWSEEEKLLFVEF